MEPQVSPAAPPRAWKSKPQSHPFCAKARGCANIGEVARSRSGVEGASCAKRGHTPRWLQRPFSVIPSARFGIAISG